MDRADTLAWIEDLSRRESVLSLPLGSTAIHTRIAISPTCGDRVELGLHFGPDGRIRLRGSVRGCTLSTAATAAGAAAVEGLDPVSARALLTGAITRRLDGAVTPGSDDSDLDQLARMALVPLRRRCVAFGWQQMVTLLDTNLDSSADVEIDSPGR